MSRILTSLFKFEKPILIDTSVDRLASLLYMHWGVLIAERRLVLCSLPLSFLMFATHDTPLVGLPQINIGHCIATRSFRPVNIWLFAALELFS